MEKMNQTCFLQHHQQYPINHLISKPLSSDKKLKLNFKTKQKFEIDILSNNHENMSKKFGLRNSSQSSAFFMDKAQDVDDKEFKFIEDPTPKKIDLKEKEKIQKTDEILNQEIEDFLSSKEKV